MKIISNNCVGGFLYKFYKSPYNNPFIWVNVKDKDYVYLANHFNEIDFMNYTIELDNKVYTFFPDTYDVVVNIDNKIKLYYTHHLYSANAETETIVDKRYISKDMCKKVEERYVRHIQRMLESKEEPIFVYYPDDEKYIDDFINNENINKILICKSKNNNRKKRIVNHIKISGKRIPTTIECATYLFNHYWNYLQSKNIE